MNKIYLDNAASSPMDERVLEAMLPYFTLAGNASSIHAFGKSLKVAVEDARDNIAKYLGVKSKEIFFTSGGTESNNTALKGVCLKHYQGFRREIISSGIEHPAVLDTLKYICEKYNFTLNLLKPDKRGEITADAVRKEIKDDTFMISLMHANNETGVLTDIKSIAENRGEIYFHSDTVQSVGKMKLNYKEMNIDFASVSGHKIYGPKGIGVLYINENAKIEKYIHGGGQERDMRGGTENVPAIVGLSKAFDLLREGLDSDLAHYKILRDYLLEKLKNEFGENVIFNSSEKNGLYNIVNISFDTGKLNVNSEMLLIQLDLKGIAVSGGSACSSGSLKPSRVLLELGRDENTAMASLRISFGRKNKKEEIDYLMEALRGLIIKY